MLDTLSRWNRWGTAILPPGVPRDVTTALLPFVETPEVVALVGPRRAGKSTILFQLMEHLLDRGEDLVGNVDARLLPAGLHP